MSNSAAHTMKTSINQQFGFVPENVISLETLKAFSKASPARDQFISDFEQRIASGEEVVIYLVGQKQLFMGPPPESLIGG